MAADGSIIIDTRIDTGGISKGVTELGQQAGELEELFSESAFEIISALYEISDASRDTSIVLEDQLGFIRDELEQIRESNNSLGQSVSATKKQISLIGSTVKKLGVTIAAAFSVTAIVNFAKEAIELGSDLQEVQNVVDVTYTTLNEQVNEFAKNAATTAGLSETMAKQYAGTFGAMANAFQFTEAEAYDMATSLTQLAGDVASFYNITQDEAYTKLKSVFTGETESLKDLGVVMTQTALDDFALRKGLSKTTSEMTEQEKVALRYQFVLEQLSAASGDFARTSDGWANQTRILSLQFDQLKATLGQGLINALTPAIKVVNELIARLQVLADQFLDFTEAVFGNAGDASSGLTETAESAADLTENIEEAGNAAKKALAPFDEIVKITSDDTQDSSAEIIPSVSAGVTETGNTDQTAKEVDKLSAAFEKLNEIFEPLKKISFANVSKSLKGLLTALKPYGKLALDGLSWLWNDILVPLAEWTIEDALPAFLDTVSALLLVMSPILTGIQPTLSWLWNDIIVPMGQFIGDAFIEFLSMLADAFRALSEWASENQETVDAIFQIFLGFLAGVWIYKTSKNLIGFLSSLGKSFSEFGNLLAAGGLKSAFMAVAVGILAAGIITLATNWNKLSGLERAVTIFGALVAAITAAAIAVAVFHTAWSVGVAAAAIAGGLALLGLTFAFTDNGMAADSAEQAANNFYNSYDWNKTLSLPMLAEGAVIPPNAPFAAILGDQRHGTNIEAPLSTIQEAVAVVMEDMVKSNIAGHEATVAVLKEILEAILGIEIGDDTIGQAVARYNAKMAIIRGGNA